MGVPSCSLSSPFLTPRPSSKKESHFPGKNKKSEGDAAAISVLLLLSLFGSREIYDTRKLLGKAALLLLLRF